MRSVGRTEDWLPAAHDVFVPLEGAAAKIEAGNNRGHPKNLSVSLASVSGGRAEGQQGEKVVCFSLDLM